MMIFDIILFYFMNSLISATSQFQAVFSCIIVYIVVSTIIYYIGLQYLSIIFIIIYVGALTILFIFAIMLSD